MKSNLVVRPATGCREVDLLYQPLAWLMAHGEPSTERSSALLTICCGKAVKVFSSLECVHITLRNFVYSCDVLYFIFQVTRKFSSSKLKRALEETVFVYFIYEIN